MKYVWLDCDPVRATRFSDIQGWPDTIAISTLQGHDDATAIMLAVQCPNITLLGVSTVSLIDRGNVPHS